MGLVIFSTNELLALLREKLRIHLQHTYIMFRLDLKQVFIKARVNRRLLSKMPMTISRAGKPSKPWIAKQNADVSFLHCFRVVSDPVLTSKN